MYIITGRGGAAASVGRNANRLRSCTTRWRVNESTSWTDKAWRARAPPRLSSNRRGVTVRQPAQLCRSIAGDDDPCLITSQSSLELPTLKGTYMFYGMLHKTKGAGAASGGACRPIKSLTQSSWPSRILLWHWWISPSLKI